MDRYIGIDVHARSCTVAVVDAVGKRVAEHVVETNGQALVDCLRMVPGQRHVCIEEGTQSAWLQNLRPCSSDSRRKRREAGSDIRLTYLLIRTKSVLITD